MKNINDFYKDEFKKIDISNEKRDEINNQIKNKYMLSQRRKKTIICLSSIFLVFIVSISIVYADEIKEFINTFKIIVTTDKDGRKIIQAKSDDYRKIINYDADFREITPSESKNSKEYTLSEIEKMLNIKVLRSNFLKNYTTKQFALTKESGKIATAQFIIPNALTEKKKKIQMRFSFVTKYYPDESYSGWKSSDSLKNSKYFIENLKSDAYILTINGEMGTIGHYNILLIYDDILYNFTITIIEENQEKQKQFVEDFLNSLSY